LRVSPNLARFQARVHKRLEAERAKQSRGARAQSEKLVKKQEERKTLTEAAKRAHERRVDRLMDEYKPFRQLIRTLDREEKDTRLVEQGVVDLDLPHLITSLGVHKLPLEARQMAVSEVHTFIRRVHKKRTGASLAVNVDRLFDPSFKDSLDETKLALRVH